MCTYGTPWLSGVDASAAICYSNVALYICLGVGGWNPKCETRCNAGSSWNSIFPWGSPTWPWALCPLKRFPSIWWYLFAQRVSLFPLLSIFSIKKRIYHCPYRSPNFTLLRFILSIQNISLENVSCRWMCSRMRNKLYLIGFPFFSQVSRVQINILMPILCI